MLLLVHAVGTPKPQSLTDAPTSSTAHPPPPLPPEVDGGNGPHPGGDGGVSDGGGGVEGGGQPEAGGDGGQSDGGQSDARADGGGSADATSDDGSGGAGDANDNDAMIEAGGGGGDDGAVDANANPSPSQPNDASDDDGGGSSSSPPPDGGSSDAQSNSQPPPPDKQPHVTQEPSQSPSNAPVAVVLFDDDYSSPSQAYYFRQDALSQYNGTRLVTTSRGDADRDIANGFPTTETSVPQPTVGAQPLSDGGTDGGRADAGDGGFGGPPRTLVRTTIALLVEHNNPFGLESPISYAPAKNPNTARFVGYYKAKSLSQTAQIMQLLGRPMGDPSWTPELRAYYTQGPADPRYRALADAYVAKLPASRRNDPLTQAVAIKLGLDHDLTYSTKAKHEGADPTADFLFGNKIGYCVHFAHAAVFLWRSLGIPARIGIGYMSEEENRHGGSALVLRGSDAHAWPEVYVDGVGWIVLDIHAEKDLDPPPQSTDEDLTRLLGDLARDEPENPEDSDKKKSPPVPPMTYLWIALSVLGAIVLVLYVIKIARRLAPRFSDDAALPRTGYRLALDLVGEVGFERKLGETREAFAERVADSLPAFAKVTEMHLEGRLRAPEARKISRPQWEESLAMLRIELAKKYGFGRRLLGRLHPLSFLGSR
jgi:transglutaminase-like putative cysteine protease